MIIWIYIVAAMVVQELAVVAAALGFAYHLELNIFLVHGIWLVATVIDALGGFILGQWIRGKYGAWVITRHAEALAEALERRISTNGRRLTLVVFGFLNFPYVNGFIGSWLNLSFADTLVFTLIGDALWYVSIWGTVAGINIIPADSRWGVVVGIGLVIALVLWARARYHKRRRA